MKTTRALFGKFLVMKTIVWLLSITITGLTLFACVETQRVTIYEYVCENGTPPTGTVENATQRFQCHVCNMGWVEVKDGKVECCLPSDTSADELMCDIPGADGRYPYVCFKGTPALGTSTMQDVTNCSECDKDYELDTDGSCTAIPEPLTITDPSPSGMHGQTTATFTTQASKNATIYWGVYPMTHTAPADATALLTAIMGGMLIDDSGVTGISATAGMNETISIMGLSAGTDYVIYTAAVITSPAESDLSAGITFSTASSGGGGS